MDIEIWRKIPGFEDKYEVSTLGRVRSLDQLSRRKTRYGDWFTVMLKGRILRPAGRVTVAKNKNKLQPHPTVCLGRGKTKSIHTLVALAFLGPRQKNMEVCHVDGNCLNNRLENLRYASKSENQQDMLLHGARTIPLGEVVRLKVLANLGGLKRGEMAQMARKLGITTERAWGIAHGYQYKNTIY